MISLGKFADRLNAIVVADGSDAAAVQAISFEPRLPPHKNPVSVYLAGLQSDSSRRPQRQILNSIARFVGNVSAEDLPWHRLGFQHIMVIRSHLAKTMAPATANRGLSAVRKVIQVAFRLQLMTAEEKDRATMGIPPVVGSRLGSGRSISREEMRSLFATAVADDSPFGIRDHLILALLYAGGLRRHELSTLTMANVEPGAHLSLRVLGKGNKERRVLARGADAAYAQWIGIRGTSPGPLLCALSKKGCVILRPVSDQTIRNRLSWIAARAGVAHFSPHDLRRTFVGDMLDRGGDLSTVSAMVGHAKVTTTALYDRRGARAMEEASLLLDVPQPLSNNAAAEKGK